MIEQNPDEKRDFFDLPSSELDQLMCRFFMYAKKVEKKSANNGENLYQPDTLNSFRNTWQRVNLI